VSETPWARGGNGQRPDPSADPISPAGAPHAPTADSTLPVRTYEASPYPCAPASGAPADFRAGTAALAAMPDDEFELRLIAMRRGRERITRIHRELMDPNSDYGVIPGTRQPTLLKPGAEKLCDFYRLAAEFQPEIRYGDGRTTPPITVVTECRLHLGTLDGPVVNTGHGAANSWEKRYRYRRGERSCPACGKTGTIIKGKAEYGGGWVCYAKKGGCGAKFADEAPEIVEQPVGDVENPDPYDLLNTLLKMAEKRSYVDATLRATATSGLYTQDLEEGSSEVDRPGGTTSDAPACPEAGATPNGNAPSERPGTLKEAYLAFQDALAEAGFPRGDGGVARRLMLAYTGRKSTQAEPYTIEEFLDAAERVRREYLPGGAARAAAGQAVPPRSI
jgi:hypothetical protein